MFTCLILFVIFQLIHKYTINLPTNIYLGRWSYKCNASDRVMLRTFTHNHLCCPAALCAGMNIYPQPLVLSSGTVHRHGHLPTTTCVVQRHCAQARTFTHNHLCCPAALCAGTNIYPQPLVLSSGTVRRHGHLPTTTCVVQRHCAQAQIFTHNHLCCPAALCTGTDIYPQPLVLSSGTVRRHGHLPTTTCVVQRHCAQAQTFTHNHLCCPVALCAGTNIYPQPLVLWHEHLPTTTCVVQRHCAQAQTFTHNHLCCPAALCAGTNIYPQPLVLTCPAALCTGTNIYPQPLVLTCPATLCTGTNIYPQPLVLSSGAVHRHEHLPTTTCVVQRHCAQARIFTHNHLCCPAALCAGTDIYPQPLVLSSGTVRRHEHLPTTTCVVQRHCAQARTFTHNHLCCPAALCTGTNIYPQPLVLSSGTVRRHGYLPTTTCVVQVHCAQAQTFTHNHLCCPAALCTGTNIYPQPLVLSSGTVRRHGYLPTTTCVVQRHCAQAQTFTHNHLCCPAALCAGTNIYPQPLVLTCPAALCTGTNIYPQPLVLTCPAALCAGTNIYPQPLVLTCPAALCTGTNIYPQPLVLSSGAVHRHEHLPTTTCVVQRHCAQAQTFTHNHLCCPAALCAGTNIYPQPLVLTCPAALCTGTNIYPQPLVLTCPAALCAGTNIYPQPLVLTCPAALCIGTNIYPQPLVLSSGAVHRHEHLPTTTCVVQRHCAQARTFTHNHLCCPAALCAGTDIYPQPLVLSSGTVRRHRYLPTTTCVVQRHCAQARTFTHNHLCCPAALCAGRTFTHNHLCCPAALCAGTDIYPQPLVLSSGTVRRHEHLPTTTCVVARTFTHNHLCCPAALCAGTNIYPQPLVLSSGTVRRHKHLPTTTCVDLSSGAVHRHEHLPTTTCVDLSSDAVHRHEHLPTTTCVVQRRCAQARTFTHNHLCCPAALCAGTDIYPQPLVLSSGTVRRHEHLPTTTCVVQRHCAQARTFTHNHLCCPAALCTGTNIYPQPLVLSSGTVRRHGYLPTTTCVVQRHCAQAQTFTHNHLCCPAALCTGTNIYPQPLVLSSGTVRRHGYLPTTTCVVQRHCAQAQTFTHNHLCCPAALCAGTNIYPQPLVLTCPAALCTGTNIYPQPLVLTCPAALCAGTNIYPQPLVLTCPAALCTGTNIYPQPLVLSSGAVHRHEHLPTTTCVVQRHCAQAQTFTHNHLCCPAALCAGTNIYPQPLVLTCPAALCTGTNIYPQPLVLTCPAALCAGTNIYPQPLVLTCPAALCTGTNIYPQPLVLSSGAVHRHEHLPTTTCVVQRHCAQARTFTHNHLCCPAALCAGTNIYPQPLVLSSGTVRRHAHLPTTTCPARGVVRQSFKNI